MNILEQEDMVKGLPDQILIQQAQMPTGEIPQFLVVSELDRRQKMRKNFAERVPEGTVAERVVSEGIAAMNPNPDPLMTAAMGAMPPQDPMMMAAGGGMMPYPMANGGDTPRMSQVPQLTQAQLNAILADGITEEEAKLLEFYGTSFDDLTLGQRINNPLNVRSSAANQWEGGDPTMRERGYEGFESPDYGLRAADRVLDTYARDYGIDTLSGALRKFAPEADDNPTQAYIDFVAERSGINPDAPIDLTNPAVRSLVLSPMAEFESQSIYSPEDIQASIERANQLVNRANISSQSVKTDALRADAEDIGDAAELIVAPDTKGQRTIMSGSPLNPGPRPQLQLDGSSEDSGLSKDQKIKALLEEAANISDKEREQFLEKTRSFPYKPFPSFAEDVVSEPKIDLPRLEKQISERTRIPVTSVEEIPPPFLSMSGSPNQPGPNQLLQLDRSTGVESILDKFDPRFNTQSDQSPDFVVDSSQRAGSSAKSGLDSFLEFIGPKPEQTPEERREMLLNLLKPTEEQIRRRDEERARLGFTDRPEAVDSERELPFSLADDGKPFGLGSILYKGVPVSDRLRNLISFAGESQTTPEEEYKQAMLDRETRFQGYRDAEAQTTADQKQGQGEEKQGTVKEDLTADKTNVVESDERRIAREEYEQAILDRETRNRLRAARDARTDVEEDDDTSNVSEEVKQSFFGGDPFVGGLALAQLGAGIAQGDIGAGITGATKVMTDAKNRELLKERYATDKAYRQAQIDLAGARQKALSQTNIITYEKAYELAEETLSGTPEAMIEGVRPEDIHKLALQIMQGNFDTTDVVRDEAYYKKYYPNINIDPSKIQNFGG